MLAILCGVHEKLKSPSGREPQGCGLRASIFGDYTEAIFAASDKAVGSKGRQDT